MDLGLATGLHRADATPAPLAYGPEGDERRMQVRAYRQWLAAHDNDELPAIEDLEPERLDDLGPNGVLIDLTLGISHPAIVYLGARLLEECGDEADLFGLEDVPRGSLLSRLTEHCLEVVANRAPIGIEAEFVSRTAATVLYRCILMPYSSDGTTVNFVFGVINWKEATN